MKFINAIFILALLFSGAVAEDKKEKKKVYIADTTEATEDYVEIDFKDLKIIDLVKLVAKIIDKNILITDNVTGNVDFISTKPIKQTEVYDLLLNILESKGFTVVGDGDILQVIRATEAAKSTLPIVYEKDIDIPIDYQTSQLVTELIDLKNENVDVVSSKIRHLSSKYGKIITNTNTNTLIITDYPSNIIMLKQAIRVIARDSTKEIRLVPIQNIRLNTIASHITKIINSYYTTTIIPSRVTVIENKEINSLVLIGNAYQLDFLKDLIEDIDSKALDPVPEDVIEVIYLKNTESKSILATLKTLINRQSSTPKGATSSSSKAFVSADNETNSIVFIGPKEDVSLLKETVAILDKEKQQVYVNVKIIEISKKISDSIGAKYGLSGGALTDSALFNFALNLGGSTTASSALAGLTGEVKQGIILGAGVDFLVENSIAKVVSEPSIISINNQESSINVGETRSILTSSSVSSTTTNNAFKREDIGLQLKVKPRISNDNKVTLAITAKLEDVVAGTGGGGTPTTTKREIQTTAIVNHGESVVVGGLVRRKQTTAINGISGLSRIPILGRLFGNNVESYDNTNLVIIMTPYVVETSSNLSKLREELAELSYIKDQYLSHLKNRLDNLKDDLDLSDLK